MRVFTVCRVAHVSVSVMSQRLQMQRKTARCGSGGCCHRDRAHPCLRLLKLSVCLLQSQSIGMNPLYVMVPCTLSASFAFMLPVATPPNAIVFSYGYLKVADMVGTTSCLVKYCRKMHSCHLKVTVMQMYSRDHAVCVRAVQITVCFSSPSG